MVSIRPSQISDQCGFIQQHPLEHRALVIRCKMAGDESRHGANGDNRGIRRVHLVPVRHIHFDPQIMARIAARTDPHGHRQTGCRGKQVRHLEKVFDFGFARQSSPHKSSTSTSLVAREQQISMWVWRAVSPRIGSR